MDNIIDVHKTIYSPIESLIVIRMSSSICWSNEHIINEIKTNPQLFKEFSFHFNEYKNNYNYYLFFLKIKISLLMLISYMRSLGRVTLC